MSRARLKIRRGWRRFCIATAVVFAAIAFAGVHSAYAMHAGTATIEAEPASGTAGQTTLVVTVGVTDRTQAQDVRQILYKPSAADNCATTVNVPGVHPETLTAANRQMAAVTTSPHMLTGLTAGTEYCLQYEVSRSSGNPVFVHSPVRRVSTDAPPATPVAMAAGPSAAVAEGATVTLTATGTTDPQGTTDLQYAWTQVDGASSTNALAITHADYVGIPTEPQSAPTPAMALITFTAPSHYAGGSGSNALHFRLQVTDPQGNTDDDHVTVMVSGANTPPTTPVITVMHTPPEEGASAVPLDADAARIAPSIPAMGDTAAMNSRVVLSVTASDPDTGDAVTEFEWQQVTEARGTTELTGTADADANDAIIDLDEASGRSASADGSDPGAPAGRTAEFRVPAFVDADGMPTAAGQMTNAAGEMVPRTAPLLLHFRVRAMDGEDDSLWAYITIAVAAPSGGNSEVVDRAILPHVIRALERQVHNSIYQRIQQRQRQDGRWK